MEKAILLNSKHLDYSGIKWVLKAIDKKKDLYNLDYLNITEGLAVGTDGYRLHQYTLSLPDEFEIGLYRFFIVNNKIILILDQKTTEYPDWKKLFLEAEPIKKLKLPVSLRQENLNTSYVRLIRWLPEEEGMNLSYLKDILSFGNEYDVYWYKLFEKIIFVNGNHKAIVMPIRI